MGACKVPEKHLPLPHISNADTCKNAEALIRTLTFGQTHRHGGKPGMGVFGGKLPSAYAKHQKKKKLSGKPSPRRF